MLVGFAVFVLIPSLEALADEAEIEAAGGVPYAGVRPEISGVGVGKEAAAAVRVGGPGYAPGTPLRRGADAAGALGGQSSQEYFGALLRPGADARGFVVPGGGGGDAASAASPGAGGAPSKDLAAMAAQATGAPKFRPDGRCGPSFPAPGAPSFGECDPHADADQKGPCCNPNSGYCGNVRHTSWGHCDCNNCVDFSPSGSKHQNAPKPPAAPPRPPAAPAAPPFKWPESERGRAPPHGAKLFGTIGSNDPHATGDHVTRREQVIAHGRVPALVALTLLPPII